MKTSKALLAASGLLALVAAPALANEPGTWILRAGVGTVQPSSNNFSFSDEEGSYSIDVDNGTAMTLTATYMLSRNWAIDVLAATPFSHDIKLSADIIDPTGEGSNLTVDGLKFAKTKQIPPTVSFQYHFAPDANFQPYVGLGLNWTTFSDTKFVSAYLDAEEELDLGVDKLRLDDSYGVAGQLGADWTVADRWVVNLDVRWMDIDTDASVGGAEIEGMEKLGTIEIDPWTYAVNLGYRF